jgi:adenylate cyclase
VKRLFRLSGFRIGFLATLFILFVYFLDPLFLRLIELKTLDLKLKSRGPLSPGHEVVIAAVDEKSLDELGKWPWPRTTLAQLVDTLTEYGAGIVGFDVVFAKPDDSGLHTILSLENRIKEAHVKDRRLEKIIASEKEDADRDGRFARSIKKSGNVVLGYFFYMSREELKHKKKEDVDKHGESIADTGYKLVFYTSRKAKQSPLDEAYAVESSLKILGRSARAQGYLNYIPDEDGAVRRIPMVIKYQGKPFPSFPLVIAREFLHLKNLPLRIADFGVAEIKLGDTVIPTDERGHFLIDYYGASGSFPHYSVSDILQKRISPDRLKGKIVLIGSTSIEDLKTTPFDRAMPGIEIHATIVDNLLNRRFIIRPEWIRTFDIAVLLALGILLSLLISRLKTVHGILLILILIPSYFFADRSLFVTKGWWLSTVYPVATIVAVYASVTIYRYLTEEREKRFIKGAFGQYLSPVVIDRLIENPDMLKLGGERRILTALFSDVAGFSTISEKLKPEELVGLLNDYLTEMTDIVLRHGGTIDKYEGDALIAFFGAPVSMEDHALKACLSAVEMQKRLSVLKERWKKEGRPELFTRIGLNTGPMVVGNMGSKTRMDYTVMGDAVNLASRLEGINKQYGTSVIMSRETFLSCNGRVEARELDHIRVVGKSEPVVIYELLDTALSFYKEKRWKEALDGFQRVLGLDPHDGPAGVYIRRCEEYLAHSPSDGWDGVFDHREK